MDAGAPNSYEDRLRNFQTEASKVKSQEGSSGDDGYETSHSGDRHPPAPPTLSPPAPTPLVIPSTPTTPPAAGNMSAPSEQTDTDSNNKSDKPDPDESMEPDADAESHIAAGSSLSNSPKVDQPEDSRSDLSAEASNSQSSMRSTQPQYDPSDTLNQGLMHPQEDSSSQSHEQPYDVRSNPYGGQDQLPPHFLQAQRDQLSFGGLKRDYDGSEGMQQMYPQYRREDYYPKYGPGPYKNEMQYGGYNRESDAYGNNVHRQFDMYNQVKREQDEMGFNGVKRECDDPYSFVEEEAMMGILGGPQGAQGHMMLGHGMDGAAMQQHMMMSAPKKRGRKKKVKDENGMEMKQEPGMDGVMMPIKPVKERKKHDRFNGMSEEEVARRTLPDHLTENLDIIIIGINPGLFAAYKGHHYAGPGNHFWKCLYLSGLTREQMSADEDYKLLNFGIGFTNMVQRATKGSADLTRREIKEGSAVLLEKLQTYRPKVAVFNGKLIYEVFSGKKDFCFGKQPDTVAGTNTYMWVMPSSSARCAQLPRAADKVPFYAALKKFRDYLNGSVHHIEESELVFPDTTSRRPQEEIEIRRNQNAGESSNPQPHYTQLVPRNQLRLTSEPDPSETMILEDGTEVPLKKKRGRPKKVKLENGEIIQPAPRPPRQPKQPMPIDLNGELPPKKKRGRPKKIRPEEQQFLLQQQQQNQQILGQPLPPMPGMQPTSNPSLENQFNIPQNPEFQNQSMGEQMEPSNLMYQQNAMQPQNLQMGQNSPYFQSQQSNPSLNQTNNAVPSLDNSGQMDLSQHGPNANVMSMQRPQSYSQSPGPYSQSPLPQGMGYSQSPRPQGYSQSPQRHQTPSYSNSPVPRPGGTPQPSNPIQSPYSPAQQNANQQSNTAPFSQTSPQRPQSQNHSYSSPVRNPYSRSPIPQNNTPSYSQPQQSPMYAHSPAGSAPGYQQLSPAGSAPGYQQLSPASQIGNYSSQSPAPNRFSQSPAPLPFSRSPAPQNMSRPYERSPAPSAPFPQRSPAMAAQPVTYSQHNSPVQNTPQNYSPHQRPFESPMQTPGRSSVGPNPFAQSPANQNREYPTDLSSEISAAISSPGPVSPGMGHIDFEPPIATNKIRVPENEEGLTQDNSPGGNTNVGGEQSNDNNSMPENRMQRPLHSHSALDLIGTPTSAPSDLSVQSSYSDSLESGLRHEQRVGFQVPPVNYNQPSPKPEDRHPYSYDQNSALSAGSPRLTDTTSSVMSPHHTSMQQHPSMYPFNRMTPTVLGSQGSPFSPAFRSPAETAPPSGPAASPSEYGAPSTKSKSQDVASKSLSGLESLVDQIPSIAEGVEPGPTLPDYALYPPYPHYQASYQPNTTYPGLVGYSAPYVMRPTPGYLPEALGYHTGYAGQYGAGYNLQQAAAGNYPYYNGHYPPQPPPNPYLSTHVLEHIHKNADSSVSFGGYC